MRTLERAAARGDASRLLDRLPTRTQLVVQRLGQYHHRDRRHREQDSGDPATRIFNDSGRAVVVGYTSIDRCPLAGSGRGTGNSLDRSASHAGTDEQSGDDIADAGGAETGVRIAPAAQPPRAPIVADFMFAILKALLNPTNGMRRESPRLLRPARLRFLKRKQRESVCRRP